MITHDGLRLHVATHGPAAAPLTVVLAHCWTADAEDWHYQVTDLLSRFGHGIRVLTWDHRGHGRSDAAPLPSCTVADLARDMGDVIDEFAADGPLVLAGHSIGGMAMMALAEQRPDLLARCVGAMFVATSSGRLDQVTLGLPELPPRVRSGLPHLLAHRARRLSRRTRRSQPAIERHIVRSLLFGRPMRLADQGLVVDQLIACPPATMEGFFRDLLTHERTDALAAFTGVPTRVLVGQQDKLTPPDHGRRIAAAIPGARLTLVPGAGHMLTLERDATVSAQLAELVSDALATASATPPQVEGAPTGSASVRA